MSSPSAETDAKVPQVTAVHTVRHLWQRKIVGLE